MKILDAQATAAALPWPDLLASIDAVVADRRAGGLHCPPRTVLPITANDLWLLMPAWSAAADLAVCKLITVHPGNPDRGLALIQGDVLAIRASTGQRLALLDGPTVTGRRTAAVSAWALRRLLQLRETAPQQPHQPQQRLQTLIIGCGVQGRSHLEALAATLPVGRFLLQSRSRGSAERLADWASAHGIDATVVGRAADAVPEADIVVMCTPASRIALDVAPRQGTLVAAVGAYTATMAEIAPEIVRGFGRNILLDTPDARHEGGDLLVAGIDPEGLPTLLDDPSTWSLDGRRSLLFKSCGSAIWDLAAARTAAEG